MVLVFIIQWRASLAAMLRRILAFSTIALATAVGADRPVKVVLLDDSTVNDEGGWGPGFRASFGPEIQIVNWRSMGAVRRVSATKAPEPRCCRRNLTSC